MYYLHFYLDRFIFIGQPANGCVQFFVFLHKMKIISTHNADRISVNFREHYLEGLDFCLKLVFRFYFIIPSNLHLAAVALD